MALDSHAHPHPGGSSSVNHPRIFRDFNDRLDRTTYGLRARGTRDDLARLPEPIAPGTRLTLYDDDAVEDGKPAWVVAEASSSHCRASTCRRRSTRGPSAGSRARHESPQGGRCLMHAAHQLTTSRGPAISYSPRTPHFAA